LESAHYAPPRAPVVDAPAPESSNRWLAITAISLVGFVAVLQFGSMIQMIARARGADIPFWAYLPVTLEFVFLASVAVLLLKKQGWARWVLVVLTLWRIFFIVTTAIMISRLATSPGFSWTLWLVTQWAIRPVCMIAAIVLVFGPARSWFQRPA
jgi:hypothetical protein